MVTSLKVEPTSRLRLAGVGWRKESEMRKGLIAVGLIVVALVVIRRIVLRSGASWEEIFERMPDNAPPKWMFNNIRAIRENTDRILEDLEEKEEVGPSVSA